MAFDIEDDEDEEGIFNKPVPTLSNTVYLEKQSSKINQDKNISIEIEDTISEIELKRPIKATQKLRPEIEEIVGSSSNTTIQNSNGGWYDSSNSSVGTSSTTGGIWGTADDEGWFNDDPDEKKTKGGTKKFNDDDDVTLW